MNNLIFALIIIFTIIIVYNIVMIVIIWNKRNKISLNEIYLIDTFYSKVNKIPALVEIMKKYTNHPDIFEDILYLHKLGIIYNIKSVYDLLELNLRIHKEFQFLMKLSAKIPELHRDWNFLYIRDYVVFYEKKIEKDINSLKKDFEDYNNLIRKKNFSILWFLFYVQEKLVF